MAKIKNAVIGCVTRYNYTHIEPWVVSLEKSGFEGDKIVIYYELEQNTLDILYKKGFQTLKGTGLSPNICVNRFHDVSKFLNENVYNKVITTDVRDVIFQHDPIEELSVKQSNLLLTTEGLNYEDEPWGSNNLLCSFGDEIYDRLKNKIIVNAGVIGGTSSYVAGLSENIYQLCAGRPQYIPGGGGPDQAALNFLVKLPLFNSIVDYSDDWVCQAGTLADPSKINQFRSKLLIPEPRMTVRGIVTTSENVDYSMVHQYDRVPLWKEILDRKYRE